jgi:hypothetical protein
VRRDGGIKNAETISVQHEAAEGEIIGLCRNEMCATDVDSVDDARLRSPSGGSMETATIGVTP